MKTTRLPRLASLRGFPGMGRMATLGPAATSTEPPSPPLWWDGTPYEWMVNAWLSQNGVPFSYRAQVGPTLPGQTMQASRPAFVVGDRVPGLVIEVQQEGGYLTSKERQDNAVRRSMLESAGYQVVGVLARDLEGELDQTMRAALDAVQRF